jgi:hypothetical protein
MKKVMFFLSFVFLNIGVFSISGFCSSNMVVGPPKKISNLNSGGGDFECVFGGAFTLQVANLDLLHGVPCLRGQVLTLPAGYPEMFLEVKVDDNVIETIPVDSFYLTECAWEDHPSIYSFSRLIYVNYGEDYCTLVDDEFLISIELVTSTSGYYPMCDYRYPGDLFDCSFFDETSEICQTLDGGSSEDSSSEPSCDNSELATFASELVKCELCDTYGFSGSNIKGDMSEDSFMNLKDELHFTVNPNPFSSNLQINWMDENTNANIFLYDLSGKLIMGTTSSSKENETLDWDTSHLAKGVYFLHVENQNESKYMKLVKS